MSELPSYRFPKKEKLKSKKDIDALFKKGKSINAFPLKAIFLEIQPQQVVGIKFGVSVPKKKIKSAVKRNLIKRRIREAYRLNNYEVKNKLLENQKEMNVMVIYTSEQILSYSLLEEKIKVILSRLSERCEMDNK